MIHTLTMVMPSSEWATDESLFAGLPGGQAVIDWFGFRPDFHDDTLERLVITPGRALFTIRASRVLKDAEGFNVVEKTALITLQFVAVSGLKMEGNAGSIISELGIRRVATAPARDAWSTCEGPAVGDIEMAFDTVSGLYGSLYAKELIFELNP